MCDYSLQHVASRPAAIGDRLVSARFGDAITRGFAASGQPDVAVCLLPGTEVTFERDVEFDDLFGNGHRIIATRLARFRQVDKDQRHMHHDALEFADGEVMLVTRLVPGQSVTVLQLPAPTAREPKQERRSAAIA
jgi:hypothetical protein